MHSTVGNIIGIKEITMYKPCYVKEKLFATINTDRLG